MDSEYDRKFEEMKKYIPFLESMIKRLENSSASSNPRQAQLDKIRSLRDLLMDKRKRMKMENLQKCEQVLVNLYAKVEQRGDELKVKIEDSSKKEKSDLSTVRSKLKSVVSKLPVEPTDTLPEIARANETEEVCVPGSKEPALFQRRPHLSSLTPSKLSPSSTKESPTSKRNYTRVLVSPEPYLRNDTSSEQPLYRRRSPKKSPRKPSPSYHRKERKKSKNKSKHNQSKDLNITLNVPEDSLNSLNTEDILSRIINCSDSDVDIATLRELRTQILGELKETGANDDISDIILKSYKNKKIKKLKGLGIKKKSEIEDGEISDSESEAIESIYGSLVVIDKNKSAFTESKCADKDNPRKIQICLVINSDKNKPVIQEDKNSCIDTSDFETFNQIEEKSNNFLDSDKTTIIEQNHDDNADNLDDLSNDSIVDESNSKIEMETKTSEKNDTIENKLPIEEINLVSPEMKEKEDESVNESSEKVIKPNFYKPLVEQDEEIKDDSKKIKECSRSLPDTLDGGGSSINDNSEIQIPLLEPANPILEPSKNVSEIDILQALKKEILNETTNVLKTDTTAVLSTPLLHQPKITKVANAKEIGPKKRISIESYKAKANAPSISRPSKGLEDLYIGKSTTKDENSRKQSLKLTEKECERFNFLSKLTLTESSDDEDKLSFSLDDIYTDLAPKSPDHEDFADTGLKPPIIIPSDPVKAPVIGSETDVDMRKLTPNFHASDSSTTPLLSPLCVEKSKVLISVKDLSKSDEKAEKAPPPLVDPRVKRDVTSAPNKDTPDLKSINVENIQSPSSNIILSSPVASNVIVDHTQTSNSTMLPSLLSLNVTPNVNIPSNIPPLFPNMTPSRTPNTAPNMTPKIPLLMTPSRTPNIPNMTPSRTPNVANMTPSRHTFDNEDFSSRKHVYAPMVSDMDLRDDIDKSRENHQWDASDSRPSFWDDRRNCSVQRDIDYRELRKDIDYRDQMSHSMSRDVDYRRSHSVQRDVDYRDTRNNSVHSSHSFDQRDYPTTPSHPFGRLDCPPTPTPSFGRLDCPPTPNPSFGRIERPMTPVHPFGRSDCPLTPSHPFGRGEPPHPAPNFGRSEYPHGSRSQDPRLNRTFDYDTYQYGDDDRERTYFQERKFVPSSYNTEHQSRDSFRRYRQEQIVGRYDGYKNYEPIHTHKAQISHRETSVAPSVNWEDRGDRGRSFNRNYEGDRYSRNRSNRGKGYDYRNQNDSKNYDEGNRYSYQRERSVGRMHETSNPIKDRRLHTKFSEENKLRVNSHSGPSFTIDTSINNSFQEINVSRNNSSSFDARRQRASSVGRTLLSSNRTQTHDIRDAFHNSEKKNRNDKKYRRACSVGREVAQSKLNFKDIKADLKSFKFKSDYRFSKSTECMERRVSTESSKKFTAHWKQKAEEIYDKFNSNTKYSPRKNNRDPRVRRDPSREKKDYKSSSRDSNNYGIVYTSDNISKGTILGPGYGVKNYKIPKIKRSQEVLVTTKTADDIGEEDASSSKNKTDLKEKDLEVTSQGENISKQDTNLNIANKKDSANDGSTELKDEIPRNEKKEIESDERLRAETNIENCIPKNVKVTENYEKKEISNDNSNKKPEETKENEINILHTSSDSLDSTERRVTRSARKNMPIEPIALELSPIKRTRKAKKSLVSESDSEDNEKLLKSNLPSKNLAQQTVTAEEHVSEQISSGEGADRSKFYEKVTKKVISNPENYILGKDNNKDTVSTGLETNKRETHLDVYFSESTKIEEENVDSRNSDELTSITLDEKDKDTEEVLDSSFGLSDLEMFSDNIASDPVIDNINSLIADLDHDLDSAKNSEANSHFTKELNLETMLENISSVDENGKNDTVQEDLSEGNKSKEVSNILQPLICSEGKIKEKNNIPLENSDSKKIEMLTKDNMQKSDISLSKPDGFEIFSSTNDMSYKIEDSKIQPDFVSYSIPCKQNENIIKLDEEDACSNDAVVSTSEDGNVFKIEKTQENLLKNETAYSPIPDSTINSNVEDNGQKNVLLIESPCEMNSDITSTHVSDAIAKDSEAVSSDAGTSKEVQSLLSILEDNSKIKELLSKIGDSKIKKKLEMLSERLNEIVSDDESTAEKNLVGDQNKVKCDAKTIVDNCDESVNKVPLDSNNQNIQEVSDINNVESKIKNCINQNEIKEDKEKNTEMTHTEENNDFEKKCSDPNKTSSAEIAEAIAQNSERNISSGQSSVKKHTENKGEEEDKTEVIEPSPCDDENNVLNLNTEKKPPVKRGKRRKGKKWCKKPLNIEEKRITRSDIVTNSQPMSFQNKTVTKKPSRELTQLQKDIGEMFIKDDVLSVTGIRMCRIAKLIDEKKSKEDALCKENNSQEPLVVLNKYSDLNESEKSLAVHKMQKKKFCKSKDLDVEGKNLTDKKMITNKTDTVLEQDPKLKLKEKRRGSLDPYVFETDSVGEVNDVSDNKNNSSSESESDSIVSTKSSESMEITEMKKKVKRKRGRLWQVGVIKPKNKKKKLDQKIVASTSTDDISETETRKVPDFSCFTDINYCFRKNVSNYNCRICLYSGTDIVHHYKKEHPHTEVPLSRLSPGVAKQAIKESEDVNFEELSRISSKKYVCRFCFKEFGRKKLLLEAFFWHIVSMHTGEYKQSCSKCVDTQICPLDIDIPPPPKDANGQLVGYICEKCNYTQISLENLKTHVIVWHNHEQVAVYTINLANLSKNTVNRLLNISEPAAAETERSRVLRSSRSNQSMAEPSDDESDSSDEVIEKLKKKAVRKSDITSKTSHIQSKITFESDVTDEISNFDSSDNTYKIETETNVPDCHFDEPQSEPEKHEDQIDVLVSEKPEQPAVSQDIFDYPHFKIKQTESGSKEYVCCINGKDNHYKTSLLISMKKHVQLKHSEQWDGYCCLCKVIVTPQGNHKFKECLQHFLDVHMDNFPILEETTITRAHLSETKKHSVNDGVPENVETNKSFINVRPLSELISTPSDPQPIKETGPILPIIESVISLGERVEQPRPSPSYPTPRTENVEALKHYRYEEFQAEVMSRKHPVVLEGMMSQIKLVHVFKCAGRFCSFSTDNAEDALLHASTHIRVGGVDSLNCAYCDFDASGNAVDLITHVFKCHGSCSFVCRMCFYRAAASQLVKAHIHRVHDKATNIEILKTSFQPSAIQEDDILSREAAVPYYLCCDKNSSDGPCKYKTYTPGKFCEHMESRHSSSTEFICFICSSTAPTPAELIGHLKTHGLKLYQCTWCVFGADNETQLLEHASALHPTRRPKAYLRIITNKEGSTDFRVLPLAHLHKSDVPVTEVAQIAQRDSPVREAERSIELEKLIGHMIESMTTTATTNASENEQNIQNPSVPPPEQPLLDVVSILENAETLIPRVNTPTPLTDQSTPILSEQSTPIIKAQSPVPTPNKLPQSEPEIVCLDSDDESPPPIETNVPAPTTPNAQVTTPANKETKKVQFSELFVCSKCKEIRKSGAALRKHINSCFSSFSRDLIPCAHCPMWLPKGKIISHYVSHSDKSSDRNKEAQIMFYCQKCLLGFSNADQVREHLVNKHNTLSAEGSSLPPFIKSVAPGPKSRRKRVLEHKEKAVEPPEKVKRYGPQDINQLPINPILDDFVVCSLCEFSTKVRLNMVRHLQLHAQQQPVPQTAPVNPVPHLETNEKHFDKMVNLASSSIGTRYPDKSGKLDNAASGAVVPPESLSRFPKYVPDKHRLTCGAKGCSYISVDESMLKCHWETLHHGVNDFHCVHCPPYQSLDTSVSVTAQRIILHLKMHDEKLYACSLCQFYHYRRQTLEKHMADVHKGGKVMIVREGKVGESSLPTAANASLLKTSAPTMDLKPWQCGLCKFKSLLRPEVVDHCAKVHNSKIQFKCAYCAYRASNPEYITNHQTKSHVGKKVDEIFYYYYREGSIPDEPDGTTRWQKQSQNTATSEPRVKSEISSDMHTAEKQIILPPGNPTTLTVDLNVVKKEVEPVQETVEDLCKEFGAFCEPNGLKYKCSLCNNVIEDSSEAMQSHLYEELKYRKWGCSICPYKAFHKEGLNVHMLREHRHNRDPIALPVNTRIETWVTKLLEHQTSLISKYKENLAKQKEEIMRTNPGPSTPKPQPQQAIESPAKILNTPNTTELEKTFGPFGVASGLKYCCPKCNSSFKDEDVMHSHLESELNRIRWCCSNCQMKFQTYHEAQFHSRSVHVGQGARPIEATRDPAVRAAWIDAVIRAQKQSMDVVPAPTSSEKTLHRMEDMSEQPENSLLAVLRYEKPVPTLEEEMARRTPASSVDSDDEKLVIDEPLENRQTKTSHKCTICNFASHSAKFTRAHVLRHYGLKPFTCPYCNFDGIRKTIEKHQNIVHPTFPIHLVPTPVPDEQPSEYLKKVASTPGPSETAASKLICLVCRNSFTETESLNHSHVAGTLCAFGKKGDVVVQCNVCRSLHKDVTAYSRHHKSVHPELLVDYVFCKLNTASMESKELLYACDNCPQKFSFLKDIKTHSEANHNSVLKYTLVPKHVVPRDLNDSSVKDGSKRKSEDVSYLSPSKRTARKSTTKLPSSTVARKSTTKLPFNVRCETLEYSYYGTTPSHEGLDGVVTMMPFYNKMVPFTFDKLKDIINIDPVVSVEKL